MTKTNELLSDCVWNKERVDGYISRTLSYGRDMDISTVFQIRSKKKQKHQVRCTQKNKYAMKDEGTKVCALLPAYSEQIKTNISPKKNNNMKPFAPKNK